MRVYLKDNSIFISPDTLTERGTNYPANSLTVGIAKTVGTDYIQILTKEHRIPVLTPTIFSEIFDKTGAIYGGTVTAVFDKLASFINSGFNPVIDTSLLATKDNQTNGLQTTAINNPDGSKKATITQTNSGDFAKFSITVQVLPTGSTTITANYALGTLTIQGGINWLLGGSLVTQATAIMAALAISPLSLYYSFAQFGNIIVLTKLVVGTTTDSITTNDIPVGVFGIVSVPGVDFVNCLDVFVQNAINTNSLPNVRVVLDSANNFFYAVQNIDTSGITSTVYVPIFPAPPAPVGNVADTQADISLSLFAIGTQQIDGTQKAQCLDPTLVQTALGCDWDNLPKIPNGQPTCILNIRNTSAQKMKLESVSFASVNTTGFYARIRVMLNTTYSNSAGFVSNAEHPNIEYDLGNDSYKTDVVGTILAEFVAKIEENNTYYLPRVLTLNNSDLLNVEITPKDCDPQIFISANLYFY